MYNACMNMRLTDNGNGNPKGEIMRIIGETKEETARAADAAVDEATIEYRACVVDVEQAEKAEQEEVEADEYSIESHHIMARRVFTLRAEAAAAKAKMDAAITASDLAWDAVVRHREKQKAIAAAADTEYGELVRARRAIKELAETVAQNELLFRCREGEWESWHKRIGKTDEFGRVEHSDMPCGDIVARTRKALENVEMILRGEDR